MRPGQGLPGPPSQYFRTQMWSSLRCCLASPRRRQRKESLLLSGIPAKKTKKRIPAAEISRAKREVSPTVTVIEAGMSVNMNGEEAGAIKTTPAATDSGLKIGQIEPQQKQPGIVTQGMAVPPKGEILDFGGQVLPSMVEMWDHCLVGHFTGKFSGLKVIHDMKTKWGVKCLGRSHNRGWIIFKFESEEDRMKVLHEGSYTAFGKLLMLEKYSEDFSFEDEEFLKILIWVKFPKLPMKLWNDEAMSEVVSMVGVPITTDKITQERFARVLIEVDVSKPPPLCFLI
ncbi:unnamed protein product [Cuscuta europaea]|uniref:DUF4283 domain-containing protein n=1 Tax=Cuscuta europaea TaxID=41803 RepID=A0A9P1ECQ4_CUSEU|nr:unnamed protein product [Cuscuta europaea]